MARRRPSYTAGHIHQITMMMERYAAFKKLEASGLTSGPLWEQAMDAWKRTFWEDPGSLYREACEIVARENRASVPILMRHMDILRPEPARRILRQLQDAGVVGRKRHGRKGYDVLDRRGFY